MTNLKPYFEAEKKAMKNDKYRTNLDVLELRVEAITYPDGTTGNGVNIYVNGKNFLEMVNGYEKQIAVGTNLELAAGRHNVLDVLKFDAPHLGMYGDRFGMEFNGEDNKMVLLGDENGDKNNWPLMCRMEANDKGFQWLEFFNPFVPEWDYSGMGIFTFGFTNYNHENNKKCGPYWLEEYNTNPPDPEELELDYKVVDKSKPQKLKKHILRKLKKGGH